MSNQEFLELEFLRFFYQRAGVVFWPADDVYQGIKDEYVEDGGTLPEDYI